MKWIIIWVPQASIFGALLSNAFICDMFYFLADFGIANYADNSDNSPYNLDKNIEFVVHNLTLIWVGSNFTPAVSFHLITQKQWKGLPWNFAAFSNISLKTSVPNLVPITCPSLQILGKTQAGVFPISRFFGQSHIKVNCYNTRTSDDIEMKLGQVTKFTTNLKQSVSRIPDAYSVKLTFSLTVTFYLTKLKTELKNL